MQYTIEVSYQTGNSFGSEDLVDTVGVFDSVEDAKEACGFILEHKKFFDSISGWRVSLAEQKALTKQAKKKPWVVVGDYDPISQFSINYKGQKLHAFWMGYFEHLYSLKIIPLQEDLTFYP